jgi:hypothetical protein
VIIIFSLAGEIVITFGVLLAENLNLLNSTGQIIIFWAFFPLVSLITGWLCRLFKASGLTAGLIPLLVFIPFGLVFLNNMTLLLFTPLCGAISLGGYYLNRWLEKEGSIKRFL